MKRGGIITALLILLTLTITPIQGYTEVAYTKGDSSNVASWRQNGDKSKPEQVNKIKMDNGVTLGEGGCSYYALSLAMVKAEVLAPAKQTVVDIYKACKDNKATGPAEYGPCYFAKMSRVFTFIESCGSNVDGGWGSDNFKRKNYNIEVNPVTGCREAMKDGYYVILKISNPRGDNAVNGHYVFVDGTSEQDIEIFDTMTDEKTWRDAYGYSGGKIDGYVLVKFKLGKRPTEARSLWSRYGDGKVMVGLDNENIDTETDQEEEDKDKDDKEDQENQEDSTSNEDTQDTPIKKEWELEGMPSKSETMKNQNPTPKETTKIDMTASEWARVSHIREQVEGAEQEKADKAIRRIYAMAGLGMCIYSAILFVLYVVDLNNPFKGISLVKICTFGLIRLDYNSYTTNPFAQNTDCMKFVMGIGLLFSLGILVCTGAIGAYIMGRIENVMESLDHLWQLFNRE